MKNRKLMITLITTFIVLLATSLSFIVYAALTKTASRGSIKVDSITVTAEATFTEANNDFDLVFTEAGNQNTITVGIENKCDVILHNYYTVGYQTTHGDEVLAKAILVYHNDMYVGTLSDIITNNYRFEDVYSFIPSKKKITNDKLTFELHQAAKDSVFDNLTLNIKISTYTESADYSKNIFVSTEAELAAAVDDMNSGLLDNVPNIVLINDINLLSDIEITNETSIFLNGYTLSGSGLVLNDEKALLKVEGSGTLSATVTLTEYDEDAAKKLVKQKALDSVGNGIESGGSKDILGHYKFYKLAVSTTGSKLTYANGTIVAGSVNYTIVDKITISDVITDIKIIGTKDAIIEDTLAHMPADGEIVTTDLYLPTNLINESGSITWTSSNTSLIDNTGKLVAKQADRETATLYAEIRINRTVTTKSYTFKISTNSNEVNFYKLVQEISPLILYNVYSAGHDDESVYYLPIVTSYNSATGEYGNYDYRSDYNSPKTQTYYQWKQYRDLRLKSITYSLIEGKYDYISLSGNAVKLTKNTLNTYAQIKIKGVFDNDEEYESYVNISIAIGNNTELMEASLSHVTERIDRIDVLANILSTRISSGIINENSDFILPASYTDEYKNVYTYTYSKVSSSTNSIKSITAVKDGETTTGYRFVLNPEYFSKTETNIYFTVTAKFGTIEQTKTFSVVAPAIYTTADFGNASIFNSIKYQVVQQLPAGEIANNTGFEDKGTYLINSTTNYMLVRDVIGDYAYINQYRTSGAVVRDEYLTTIGYTSGTYLGTKDLFLYTSESNNSNASDTAAYDFARLIQWATGTTTVSAGNVLSTAGKNKIGSSYYNLTSNGKEFLSDDEKSVLKQFYTQYTGKSGSYFDELMSTVSETSSGYLIVNPNLVNDELSSVLNIISDASSNKDKTISTIYFKWVEVLQWATNQKDFPGNRSPNQAIISKYEWSHTSGTDYLTDNKGIRWYYTESTSWNQNIWCFDSKYYNNPYLEDFTDYISENEFEVMCAFWLNCGPNADTSTKDPTYMNTTGIRMVNAFNNAFAKPTYFNGDGVSKIINQFYNDSSIAVSTYNSSTKSNTTSYKSDFVSVNKTNIPAGIKSLPSYKIPTITNLDAIGSVLNNFKNVTRIYIYGNESLNAFLSSTTLSQIYSKITLNNSMLDVLVMEYCANDYVKFDVSNIKNLNNLRYISYANNNGVTNVSVLVNSNKENYKYVDFYNVGVDSELRDFAVKNLSSTTCTVYYGDSPNRSSRNVNEGTSEALGSLNELQNLISENMYLSNSVTVNDVSSTVFWRIEDGNMITEVTAGGEYQEINSENEMNNIISSYYYCSQDFVYGTYNFYTGCCYRVKYDESNSVIVIEKVCDVDEKISTEDGFDKTLIPAEVSNTAVEEKSSNNSSYSYNTSQHVETIVNYKAKTFKITFTCYAIQYSNYYFHDSGDDLSCINKDYGSHKFAFLTAAEASALDSYLDGNITKDVTLGNSLVKDESTAFYWYCVNTGDYVGDPNNVDNGGNITCSVRKCTDSLLYVVSSSGKIHTKDKYNGRLMYPDATWNKKQRDWTFESNSISIDASADSYINVTYTNGTLKKINVFSFALEHYNRAYTLTLTEKKYIEQLDKSVDKYFLLDSTYDTLYKYRINYRLNADEITRTKVVNGSKDIVYISYESLDELIEDEDVVDLGIRSISYVGPGVSGTVDFTTDYNLSDSDNRDSVQWNPYSRELNKNWVYQSYTKSTYNTYVKDASKVNLDEIVSNYGKASSSDNKYLYWLYTGTSTSSSYVYDGGILNTHSFTNSTIYKLQISNGVLAWSMVGSGSQPNVSVTMDSILTEANNHFNDNQYGNYYGNYYAYSGSNFTSYIHGSTYKNKYVYRLFPNKDNSAFEWVQHGTKQYVYETNIDTVMIGIVNGTISEANVGDIYQLKFSEENATDNRTYHSGWYIVTKDEYGAYYLKSFQDVKFTGGTNTKITNYRLFTSSANNFYGYGSANYYGGTGGTNTIIVSAVVRVTNGTDSNGKTKYNEYVRKFKIDIIGS